MNIKFNDRNYFVRYIQAFLNKYYSTTLIVSGVYDLQTHKALKDYMDIPVSVGLNEFRDIMTTSDENSDVMKLFKQEINGEYKNPFSYWFKFSLGYDEITLTSKSTKKNPQLAEFMSTNMQYIENYVTDLGWKLTKINNYQPPYSLEFSTNGVAYEFPRDKVKCLVNLFEGQFLYNLQINSEGKIEDNFNGTTKLCMIKCKPNTEYTIYHDMNDASANITIGSFLYSRAEDLRTMGVNGLQYSNVEVNASTTYKTLPETKYLVIQVPAKGLNEIDFDESKPKTDSDLINVENLLILEGSYGSEYSIKPNFTKDPWILNEKFLAYICKRSITPCSEKIDIFKVQKIINELYPYKYEIKMPEKYDDYLIEIIRDLQISNKISFSLGYVDTETEYLLVQLAEERGLIYD